MSKVTKQQPTYYDLADEYTKKIGRAMATALDYEVYWSFDDMGLSNATQEIKEATGSTASLFDNRTWHGKWYHQNYEHHRRLLAEKLGLR